MLDLEEDASTIDPSLNKDQSESSSLQLADQSMQVAMKAEAMVRDMQKILDDFAKEDSTSIEGCTSIINESIQSPDQKIDSSVPTKVYPYKFYPSIPDEDWYVHFGNNYQKEFYVEGNQPEHNGLIHKKSRLHKRRNNTLHQMSFSPICILLPVTGDPFLEDRRVAAL